MQGQWSFSITKGGGWQRVLTISNYTLTSATAIMTMTPNSGTTVTLSTANGKISINAGAGTVTLTMTPTEVNAINWSGVVNSRLVITPTSVTQDALELIGTVTYQS